MAQKETILKGKVHLSTLVLVTIAMFDLVSTLMLMSQGFGESNPLFATIAQFGSVPFAIAKLAFLAIPIAILEYARTRHPRTAEQGTWFAAIAYFVLYAGHLIRHLG